MHLRRLATATLLAAFTTPMIATAQQRPPMAADCATAKDSGVDHAAMDHSAHSAMTNCGKPVPTSPGQATFGAIAEVVRMLKADSTTDWSKVNVEALRQHLIDMDDVIMRAVVRQRDVPGGLEMDVTGTGRTIGAIQRMAVNHTRMLDQGTEYHATARETPTGALITITAKDVSDARMVAQIHGLGFAGLMTEGDHHAAHHIAIARGDASPHGR